MSAWSERPECVWGGETENVCDWKSLKRGSVSTGVCVCDCVSSPSSSLQLIKTSVRSAWLFTCRGRLQSFLFFSLRGWRGSDKGRLWDHDAPAWKINHSDAKQSPVGTDSHPRPRTHTGPLTAAEAPAQRRGDSDTFDPVQRLESWLRLWPSSKSL